MRFVEMLVDQRVMESPMNPVDEEISEEHKDGELEDLESKA
jgi:hypothetical protein